MGFGVSGSSCGVDLVFARFIVGWVCVSGLPFGVGFGFGLVLFRVNWCLGVLIYFVIAGCCCVWSVRW